MDHNIYIIKITDEGRFVAVQYGSSADGGKLSWTTDITSIQLNRIGTHTLSFYVYYNCYDTTGYLNNYCPSVSDKMSIFIKSAEDADFGNAIVSNSYNSKSNTNGWTEIRVNFEAKQTLIDVKYFREYLFL